MLKPHKSPQESHNLYTAPVHTEGRFIFCTLRIKWSQDSSGGTATCYRLDGPGLNPGGDEIFRLSRLARGPIQPPAKPGLSRG